MRADLLDLEDACAVVATIGTTSSTSVDPVPAIAERCEAESVWLHVDAAYAGPAAVCPELRDRFAGWERADSVVVNPHKWLGVPMDCSTLWTRHRRRFPRLLLPRARVPARGRGGREPQRVQPGRSAAASARSSCGPCSAATAGPGSRSGSARQSRSPSGSRSGCGRTPHWEVVAPRPFSVVCFRLRGSDEDNERLLERVNATGEIFISHTRLADRYVLRLAIGSFRTTEDDVRLAWDVLRRESTAL